MQQLNKHPMHKTTRWWLVLMMTLPALHGGNVGAQSPGDEFNNLLDRICVNPTPELVPLCDEFVTDGGSGGGGGGVGGANNFGTLDAQNQTAIKERVESRLEEQREVKKDNPLGVFVTLQSGSAKRKTTELENGYDSDDARLLVGLDYRVSDTLLSGAIFTYSRNELDFKPGPAQLKVNGGGTSNAGKLETDIVSATTFVSYTHSENAFVDAYLGYGRLDYKSIRNIFVTTTPKQASSDTDGTQTLFGVAAHYGWPRGSWAIGFDTKIDYVKTEIDSYSEFSSKGNTNYLLLYPDQDLTSLTVSFGVDFTYNKSYSWGVLVPNAQILYVHEAENEARQVTTCLVISPTDCFITRTDKPDKDYLTINLGTSAVLPRDVQWFAELSLLANHEFLDDSWTLNIGLHKQF